MINKILIFTASALFSISVLAKDCRDMVYKGVFPTSNIPVTILCKERFVIGYSTFYKSPLWVAEFLDTGEVDTIRSRRTSNPFRQDPALPSSLQSNPREYLDNDFDRGHMVPFLNVADNKQAIAESFLMTNIVAQYSAHNRGIWKSLEGKVFQLAFNKNGVYIVTGTVFRNNPIRLIDGTAVPYALFKMVISPNTRESFTVIIDNNPTIKSESLPMFFTTIADLRNYNPDINPLPVNASLVERKMFTISQPVQDRF